MKFGVVLYKYTQKFVKNDVKDLWNIGDYIQPFAVKELYIKMGIAEENIIKISEDDLITYQGEYLVVLMNMYGGLVKLEFSPYVIPVFCGFNFAGYISNNLKDILKKNEPIGCRDEQTLENMRESGIEAFLSGCITITLDKRKHEPEKGKVFLIDTPESLEQFIPEDMLPNKVEISHIIDKFSMPFDEQEIGEAYELSKKRLEIYKKEAKLVVTGRLHCAAPCLAMGIPVIVVKKNRDINMGWFDKFVHIYTEDEFERIDWNVKVADIEEFKKQVIDVFSRKINETIENRKRYYDLSFQYESREHFPYNDILSVKLRKIVQQMDKEDFEYALWGLGDGGNIAYQMIQKEYPKAKCILAVDRYKEGMFYNNTIESPEMLKSRMVDYIFITTYNGRKDAVELLSSISKKREKDWDFLISRVGGEDQFFFGI